MVFHNNLFWKTVKPLVSFDTTISGSKIYPKEEKEMFEIDSRLVEAKFLNISSYEYLHPLKDNLEDPNPERTVFKY